jgi:hypothetical protein
VQHFFLNPWALALAGLAGGIVLLYILKLRRTRVTVGSTLLWERAVIDYKANAPWQKLRRNLLMYLQIAALLLLALALARPFLFGTALTGGRTVIILDASSSMLSTDDTPDRLGKAISAAGQLVNDFANNDEGMVLAAGTTPHILQGFTKDKSELAGALQRARPLAGGIADMDAALRLVSSVAAGSKNRARVVIFSDGAVPDLDPFAATDLRISFYPVGSDSQNVGIVGAGARKEPFGDSYDLFIALHNYFPVPKDCDVTVSMGDNVLDVRTVELQPGQRSEITLSNLQYTPEPLKVKAELQGQDLLAADDEAWVVLPKQQRFRVALCTTSESILLRKVLESMQDIDFYTYDGEKLSGTTPNPDSKIDVWVVDGDAPAGSDPGASYLFFDTSKNPFLPVTPGDEVKVDFGADPPIIPTVVGVDSASPLLRFVSMSNLRLSAVRRNQLQPWGRAVVDGSEGPLLVEGDLNGQRTLYVAFSPYNSDLPLRAAFPIFMANALNYLGAASAGAEGQTAQAGSRVNLVAPLSTKEVQITAPDGAKSALALNTRDFTLSETGRSGIYRLAYQDANGEKVGAIAVPVSLLSENESNIAPAKSLRIKGAQEAIDAAGGKQQVRIAGTQEVRVNREFYAWLIGIVLLLVGVEWYLYHTRAL